MTLTADERETVINLNDAEAVAYIYTAQRPVITKLKKNPAATLIEEGTHEGSVSARFELPAALLTFRSGRVTAPSPWNSAPRSAEGFRPPAYEPLQARKRL